MIAAAYGDVYVAQVAMGADNPQTVQARSPKPRPTRGRR